MNIIGRKAQCVCQKHAHTVPVNIVNSGPSITVSNGVCFSLPGCTSAIFSSLICYARSVFLIAGRDRKQDEMSISSC